MFGYVQIRKPELKIKDYVAYHAFYCGLCERLRAKYGIAGRMTLTYDMTFLVILLSSVYDVKCMHEKKHCIVHPAKKHNILYNYVTDYCADINMILSFYQCMDDKVDNASLRGKAGTVLYRKNAGRAAAKHKRQAEAVKLSLKRLSGLEKEKKYDIIKAADCFGRLLAEIFTYKEDMFKMYLWDMGYYLGRYIYIMDAYDDLQEDIQNKRYNPFISVYRDRCFEDNVREMLLNEISMACGAFEQLPCLDYIDILRNILYAGVWNRYDYIRAKKEDLLSDRPIPGTWNFTKCHR